MAYTAYANYVVYFSEEGDYNFALSINGGSPLLNIAPLTLAGWFGFVDGVNYNTGGALNPLKGMYTASYSLAEPGSQINHPLPSGVFLSPSVDEVTVPGQAGTFGTVGPDMLLKWTAVITYMPIQPALPTPDRAPVPIRRWAAGFEYTTTGQSAMVFQRTRDASRTVEGVGFALRHSNNVTIQKNLVEFTPAISTKKSWERVYMRVRKFGTASLDFWKTGATPTSNAGVRLWINTAGDIEIFNITTNPGTQIGTIAGVFVQDVWVKLDIIIEYNPDAAGGNGGFRIWVNGVHAFTATPVPADGGIGLNNQFHTNTTLGTNQAGANTWEVDFDDWHNAEVPELLGVESLTSYDFLLGTHNRAVRIEGGTKVNWTGEMQVMNQMVNPGSTASPANLSSSTSGAQLLGVTSLTDEVDAVGLVLAPAAVTFFSYTVIASGTITGNFGYSFAGDPLVLAAPTTNESNIQALRTQMYKLDGTVVLPASIVPFVFAWEKAASAVANTVYGASPVVEQIGIFGPEDAPDAAVPIPRINARHNAWYPSIAAAFPGGTGDGYTFAVGGTYVGNGTTNVISLPAPCHFLYVRPVASANEGSIWFGSSLGGGRNDFAQRILPDQILRADYDVLTGLSTFTVLGNNVECNQSAVTYQYIAFCDPSMQYLITGAYLHSGSGPENNLLPDPTFTPVFGFFKCEAPNTTNTALGGFKGPASTGTTGNLPNGTNLANFIEFFTGSFNSLADAHNIQSQFAYALWRTGNNCASVMCQAYSYIGDGTGSRVLTSTPASGRYPLWVMVVPRSGTPAYVKDPSDVGTSSRVFNSASTSATAITAVGNDTITVGATLNVNLVEYSVFIIPGDTAAFINGTYYPGNCEPEELIPLIPEPPLPGIHVMGNGGVAMNGQPPSTLLEDVSGIYTIVEGKRNDTLYDRQTGQPNIDVAIPRPFWKTGYIGG